jgi:hypothetical protein
MRSERIYVATFQNVTIGTTAQSIMELQVPDNTIIEILRAWISAAITATPIDEVIAIALYGNDAVATGGTAMTEQPLSPAAAADPSNVTALLEPTIGATPLDVYNGSYHLQNEFSYPPIPEEMETLIGGNADPGDNFGIRLPVASTATPAVSGGIRWREISAA